MSAVAQDLSQESAWFDQMRAHAQITREALLDAGWVAPTSWATIKQEAAMLHNFQRPHLRRMWLKMEPPLRAPMLRTIVEMTWIELGRMECQRDIAKTTKTRPTQGEKP